MREMNTPHQLFEIWEIWVSETAFQAFWEYLWELFLVLKNKILEVHFVLRPNV
jgi:hypothetical protein